MWQYLQLNTCSGVVYEVTLPYLLHLSGVVFETVFCTVHLTMVVTILKVLVKYILSIINHHLSVYCDLPFIDSLSNKAFLISVM